MRDLTVHVRAQSRVTIARRLATARIGLNASAEILLAGSAFDEMPARTIVTQTVSVASLGLPNGGTLREVLDAGERAGLLLIPLSAVPDIRLATVDQQPAPDNVLSAGRQPTGAVNVASRRLDPDVTYPAGFYLRVADGVVWLRGYTCDEAHVFAPEQPFLFAERIDAADS